MKVKPNDGISMMGHIEIRVLDSQTRKLIRRVEIRNKITFLAADVLVSLIAQRAADYPAGRPAQIPNDQIYTMRMGTSNTPASRADTNLGNPIIGKVIGDAGKITTIPGEIAFTATLELADGNGNTFQEAGLFTKGAGTGTLDAPGSTVTVPRLFARQVYPGIPKTNAITLEYTWRIAFTA
jgi:hypothetical protein